MSAERPPAHEASGHPHGAAGRGHPGAQPGAGPPGAQTDISRDPIVIFWELTRSCALACRHCRATAQPQRHPLELNADECFKVMDELLGFDQPPIVVLSGGDPFMRRDLFDIAEYGIDRGMTVSVSPSATALGTRERLQRLVDLGASRVSFSLDGPTAEVHDAFRGFEGTFERTLDLFRTARDVGLEFQVNTTVTRQTRPHLSATADLIAEHGAVLWDLFFLVPVGRGRTDDLLSAEEHEETFNWIIDGQQGWPFRAKTTLGQPYRRAVIQRRLAAQGKDARDLSKREIRGLWPGAITNDGKGIFFISHVGDVYPSGFLPKRVGNVRTDDVVELYRNAPLFLALRDPSELKGKCGGCRFNEVCGGSRARSYGMTGDPLAAEPCCVYEDSAAPA